MKTIIRQASLAEKEALWDFNRLAYEDTVQYKIPHRWTWEYLNNPLLSDNGKKLPIWVAIKDDQIVGQICGIPVEIKVGDETHLMTGGVELIVMPVCRGEGVGQKLIQALAEHYEFYIAISMSPGTRRIYGRLENYKNIDPIPMYRRLVKLERESVSRYLMKKTKNYMKLNRAARIGCDFFLLDGIISVAANPILGLRNLIERKTKKESRTDIRKIERFGDEIDRLWSETNHKFKVIVKRGQRYLNWRFIDNPLDYCCFVGTRDGETKGYIVLRKPESIELNVGIIVDLYADPDDDETIEDLIRYAIRFFGQDVAMIECPISQKEFQKAILKFGFFKMEDTIPVFFCMDSELRTKLEDWKDSWFLTKADHDWDQLWPV